MTSYPLFLQSELKEHSKEAFFQIIPVAYEKSVSYGSGTKKGPESIINASSQLEIFNGKNIPLEKGIFTHPAVEADAPDKMFEMVNKLCGEVLKKEQCPIIIGGEHTVTMGPALAIKEHFKNNVGIIQFDAHADLRDQYEGSPYSHACIMRRVFDLKIPFFQVGVRSLSPGEVDFRKKHNIPHLDAMEAVTKNITTLLLPENFPENLYITLDIDAFDSSLFPATGTPEPGGLGWYQVLSMIESVAKERKIIGFDLVEHAPISGFHASDFAAARLIYNIMGNF